MKKKLLLIIPAVVLASGIFLYSQSQTQNTENSSNSSSITHQEGAPHADWVKVHNNSTDLVNDSDIIFKGRVINTTPELRYDVVFSMQTIEITEPYAISRDKIKLLDTLDKAHPTIVLLQTGGTYGSITSTPFPEADLLEVGKEYLFFLQATPEGHYLPSGSFQGIAEVNDDTIHFGEETVQFFPDLENQSLKTLTTNMQSMPNVSPSLQFNLKNEGFSGFLTSLENE